jgi:asparaginyl-tRNA synthetase
MYATAVGKIYTFGPTFRAEDSHTTRHIAEFWMIEPEVAFADLSDNMDLAEAYLKYVIQFVMDTDMEDLEFFDKQYEKGLIERLKKVLATPFKRLTYTEAVDLLIKVEASGHKFDIKVEWGMDLKSEHERYLAEKVFNQPVILTDYPKDIKAFYMRLNDDGKTVRAMDVLVPKIGEIIGGSQREERLEVLEKRMDEMKLDKEAYKYYLDLRRFGTCVHSGFGVGFERLIMFISGIENIRDAIPFPRYPGHADF